MLPFGPIDNVPPSIDVLPVYVWTLSKVSVPAPSLVNAPVPEIMPAKLPSVAWLNTSDASSAMLPCRLAVSPSSVPALTVVPPLYVLAPASTSVPSPSLANAPVPASGWVTVNVLVASAISNPPPPGPNTMARGVSLYAVPVTWRMPPSKSMALPGSPRFASDDTESVPSASCVPPTYVLAPLRTRVPAPVF